MPSESALRFRPARTLLIQIGLIAAASTVLLMQPFATPLDPREREHFYWDRHLWQCIYDSFSAACGCGQLTIRETYSAAGRVILTLAAIAGSLAYVVAAHRASIRLRMAVGGTSGPLAGLSAVLMCWAASIALSGVVWIVVAVARGGMPVGDALMTGAATAGGCGLLFAPLAPTMHIAALVSSIFAAAGWPLLLTLVGRNADIGVRKRRIVWSCFGYFVSLALLTTIVALCEQPLQRGQRQVVLDQTLSAETASVRWQRAATAVVCAAGSGLPTEAADARSLSEGSRFALGLAAWLGGLGGSATGGVKWSLFILAFAAVVGSAGISARATSAHWTAHRCVRAAVRVVGVQLVLTIVAALGLLVIQRQTASPFDPTPGLAEAWLDASAAVNGAAVSSGISANVTSGRLSKGLGLSADLYQYGMGWLMLAMLLGRAAPIAIVSRAADEPLSDAPAGTSPLA
ncbi:MAG: hypothetical protein SF069_02260 [Phycisphaerae bacterium]|nr:hypothetical protein [Phycisphaerae bacterium]